MKVVDGRPGDPRLYLRTDKERFPSDLVRPDVVREDGLLYDPANT